MTADKGCSHMPDMKEPDGPAGGVEQKPQQRQKLCWQLADCFVMCRPIDEVMLASMERLFGRVPGQSPPNECVPMRVFKDGIPQGLILIFLQVAILLHFRPKLIPRMKQGPEKGEEKQCPTQLQCACKWGSGRRGWRCFISIIITGIPAIGLLGVPESQF